MLMHFVRIVETLNEPLLTLMKKYLLWICTAAALLAAGASCSDDPEVDSVGRVGIQQESLTADGAGEDLTLNVTSNAYWRINFTDPETGERFERQIIFGSKLRVQEGDVIEKGKLNEKFADFEKMLFDLEIGGIAMIETDVGVHIVRRNAMADKDFDDAKDDISKAVTKERIANEAKDFFEKVKNGSAKLNDETKYGSYQEAVVYSAGEMGEEVEKLIAELKDGESLIYNDDSCTVIIRRLATTDDDYKKEYSTIKSALSQEAFYA